MSTTTACLFVAGITAASVLGACGGSRHDDGDPAGDGGSSTSDGGSSTSDAPAADASDPSGDAGPVAAPRCDPGKPFGRPVVVAELGEYAGEAWLTDDEKTILYSNLELGNGLKIYTATRATNEGAFSAGQPLPNVNGSDQKYEPSLSPDKLKLFFVSSGLTLSIAFRAKVSDPFPLGSAVSLPEYRINTDSGRRPRAMARGVYYYLLRNGETQHKLYFAANGMTTATVLRETDLTFTYAITADERTLYVSDRDSLHADGTGHFVVKRATRTDLSQPFGELTPLPELSLDPDLDLRIDWISQDECVLYGTVGTTSKDSIYRAVRGM